MKRIVSASLMAFCLIAMTQQEASAWYNSKVGVGLSWDMQSGGNNFLWGLYRNGQPPGPEAFGGGYGGGFRGRYVEPMYYGQQSMPQTIPAPTPVPQAYAPQGYYPPMYGQQMPQGSFDVPSVDPSFAGGMNYSPFHFANYPRPVYYYYPMQYYGR